MNDVHEFNLDAGLLRLLLAILETGSITSAADKLGVTQSAVSHAIQRLSRAVGEPLFVKSGRGIVATPRALELAPQAKEILSAMQGLLKRRDFDLASARFNLTIAANDLQRDLLLPRLFQHMSKMARDVRIRVIPSDVPSVDLLRRDDCQLVITPRPPEGSDIVQRRLFTDTFTCFFDATQRRGPRTLAEYLAARHATVVYPDASELNFDRDLREAGVVRQIAVSAPSFAGVSAFIRGSDLLAAMPSRLSGHLMRGFGSCALPFPAKLARQLGPLAMYLVWHRRHQNDPQHIWVRDILLEVAKDAGGRRHAGFARRTVREAG